MPKTDTTTTDTTVAAPAPDAAPAPAVPPAAPPPKLTLLSTFSALNDEANYHVSQIVTHLTALGINTQLTKQANDGAPDSVSFWLVQ